MKVFKFGGASVKDADAVRNVADILRRYDNEPLTVVVSAMGKTTNALEGVYREAVAKNQKSALELLTEVRDFHESIISELFPDPKIPLKIEVDNLFKEVSDFLHGFLPPKPDYIYDQLVGLGELLSTTIIAHYLNENGLTTRWFDARKLIKTDYTYREAKIDWVRTEGLIRAELETYFLMGSGKIAISQGFIGGADSLNTTTLGREGSDYSAAIFAHCLRAERLIIWKDVPGVLNADPRMFENTVLLDEISYKDSIELSYYGASVIHPKTLQPLQDRQIPLQVKSFVEPDSDGTLIHQSPENETHLPAFISKPNQLLISLGTRDFAFIAEENLSDIFETFARLRVKLNIMQNSAVNFSVCIDDDPEKVPALLESLKKKYEVRYNEGLELLTVRHYTEEVIDKLTEGKKRYIEQRTRHTYRVLLK